MLASSGVGLKLWNLDTFDLIKEFPISGRTKQPAQINSFHIRSDSNAKQEQYQSNQIILNFIFWKIDAQLATVVDMDFIKLIDFEQKTSFDLSEVVLDNFDLNFAKI